MKTYTFWIVAYQCRITITAAHKWEAVGYVKKQLSLIDGSGIVCLGINL